MSFDEGDGYWHCPHCGNNGDQGDVHATAQEWFRGTRDVTLEVLDVTDENVVQDSDLIDECGIDIDEILDTDIDGFTCQCCGEEFSYFEYLEYSEWNDRWGGSEDIEDRAIETKAVQRGKTAGETVRMHLKTGNNDSARAISQTITKVKELDKALNIHSDWGFDNYEIYPANHSEHTTESRRLFEVGRELLAFGYRSLDLSSQTKDGEYEIRCWAVQAHLDDELELAIQETDEQFGWPLYKSIRLTVLKRNPAHGEFESAKVIFIMVPSIEERQRGKDDPDQQVVIFDMPLDLVSEVSLLGVPSSPSIWHGEVIDRLTLYRCERENLAQTLEVVFDMTPEGYLPLLKQAGVAA